MGFNLVFKGLKDLLQNYSENELLLYNENVTCNKMMAMPWHWQVATGLAMQRTGFKPRPVNMRFVMDKEVLGQGFPSVLRLFLVSVNPQC
jgi:hypothetical protein